MSREILSDALRTGMNFWNGTDYVALKDYTANTFLVMRQHDGELFLCRNIRKYHITTETDLSGEIRWEWDSSIDLGNDIAKINFKELDLKQGLINADSLLDYFTKDSAKADIIKYLEDNMEYLGGKQVVGKILTNEAILNEMAENHYDETINLKSNRISSCENVVQEQCADIEAERLENERETQFDNFYEESSEAKVDKPVLRVNMISECIKEVERQFAEEGEKDGLGNLRAWIDLPKGMFCEVTKEENSYSTLVHDIDGSPILPYVNGKSLQEMFCEVIAGQKLEYEDLKAGQTVYVVYEKDGAVWDRESEDNELYQDGFEKVIQYPDGTLDLIDNKCARNGDIRNSLENGGISIYTEEKGKLIVAENDAKAKAQEKMSERLGIKPIHKENNDMSNYHLLNHAAAMLKYKDVQNQTTTPTPCCDKLKTNANKER